MSSWTKCKIKIYLWFGLDSAGFLLLTVFLFFTSVAAIIYGIKRQELGSTSPKSFLGELGPTLCDAIVIVIILVTVVGLVYCFYCSRKKIFWLCMEERGCVSAAKNSCKASNSWTSDHVYMLPIRLKLLRTISNTKFLILALYFLSISMILIPPLLTNATMTFVLPLFALLWSASMVVWGGPQRDGQRSVTVIELKDLMDQNDPDPKKVIKLLVGAGVVSLHGAETLSSKDLRPEETKSLICFALGKGVTNQRTS